MRFEGNRRFYLIAGGIFVLLFSLGLARDLLLEKKVSPADREVPPVIIEGLDVVREIEGDKWHVKAERVEKRGDISDAETLDVVIESPEGRVWTVRSERGKINDAEGDVFLETAKGLVNHSAGELEWTAPRADWNEKNALWSFPDGFEAWDEDMDVTGERGSMTMEGSLDVEEGAVVTWKKPAR